VSVTLPVCQPPAGAGGASVCVVAGAVVSGSPAVMRKKSNTASSREVTVALLSLAYMPIFGFGTLDSAAGSPYSVHGSPANR
jgi:hypothetical protein